jgi:exosortase F-associated protein
MNAAISFRVLLAIVCIAGLTVTFVFQRFNFAEALQIGESEISTFIINRSARFLINDIFAIGLILSLFPEKKYLTFAIIVQVAGLILFLIPYFILKIYFVHYNGPLINFLHRLILNPILVLLLIPAFYYQKRGNQIKEL